MNLKNRYFDEAFKVSFANWMYTITGILFSTFALKSFLVPNHFLDGGVTGLALTLHELFHFNLAIVIILANIPFIILGSYQIGRHFAISSSLCVTLFALSMLLDIPPVTGDNLLVSIFGGLFLGIGIGLAMRGGVALDGIEVLAIYTIKRSSFKISEVILGLNVVIFAIAACFVSVEKALYAMLTYFIATRAIDFVIEGLDEYTGLTIVSSQHDIIKEKLVKEFGRGITVYKGERGFMKDSFDVSQPVDIVFTIVTRFEVRAMKIMVRTIDPKAFIFTNAINEISGGIMKKIHQKH